MREGHSNKHVVHKLNRNGLAHIFNKGDLRIIFDYGPNLRRSCQIWLLRLVMCQHALNEIHIVKSQQFPFNVQCQWSTLKNKESQRINNDTVIRKTSLYGFHQTTLVHQYFIHDKQPGIRKIVNSQLQHIVTVEEFVLTQFVPEQKGK